MATISEKRSVVMPEAIIAWRAASARAPDSCQFASLWPPPVASVWPSIAICPPAWASLAAVLASSARAKGFSSAVPGRNIDCLSVSISVIRMPARSGSIATFLRAWSCGTASSAICSSLARTRIDVSGMSAVPPRAAPLVAASVVGVPLARLLSFDERRAWPPAPSDVPITGVEGAVSEMVGEK